MKIAFIVPEFPSISQTFVLNQITGLLEMGHDVEIFAPQKQNYSKCHKDVIEYGLLERLTTLPRVPSDRLRRYLKGAAYVLRYLPFFPKVVLNSLNVFKFGRPAASFHLLCNIAPFLGKGPYDIIYCHFGPCGNTGIQCIRSGALEGKIVTVFHGYDLSSYLKQKGDRIYDALFKHGDLFLPISNFWKKKLEGMGCPRDKTVVHHMGVDTCGLELSDINKCHEKTIKILTVARLVEKKGLRYSIEAVSNALKTYPNIEYSIAGDGPLKPVLVKLIKDLNIEKRVHLLGWLDKNEVADLMKNADILIAPSITGVDGDKEGIPVVLMEALAMGLPTISTDHSGIPELIIDRHTGLLAPEQDTTALVKNITTLIHDNELKMKMRDNGRHHVQTHFDIQTLNNNLIGLFHDLRSQR